jgi:TRAP-type C4-dicarboxylate transport system permease small subunit
VAVDVLSPVLDRPLWRAVTVAMHLIGAALMAVIAWQAVDFALGSRARGEATNMLEIALWPFELVSAASMAAFAAVLFVQAWRALHPSPHRDPSR